jgi:hypothetical protein
VAVCFTVAFPLLLLWLNSPGGNRPSPRLGGGGRLDAIVPGYLLKDVPRAQLFAAVRAAARGETVLAPAIATPWRSPRRWPAT